MLYDSARGRSNAIRDQGGVFTLHHCATAKLHSGGIQVVESVKEMNEIEKLDAFGREYGFVIYNVHQCNAGWGVQWFEGSDSERTGADWRRHLHVYSYHPTIAEMVKAEIARVKARVEALGKT